MSGYGQNYISKIYRNLPVYKIITPFIAELAVLGKDQLCKDDPDSKQKDVTSVKFIPDWPTATRSYPPQVSFLQVRPIKGPNAWTECRNRQCISDRWQTLVGL